MIHMLAMETIKLVVALGILGFIFRLRETKPISDPFFADQKWTLTDAYKILVPLLIGMFLLFMLSQSAPKLSRDVRGLLRYLTILLWFAGVIVPFWLIIKTPHNVTANTFGLRRSEFLRAAVLPTNVVAILFLLAISSASQLNTFPYTDVPMWLHLLTVVAVVLFGSLLEELLWRGILYPPIIRRMPKWQAMACVSLTESLSHLPATLEEIFWRFWGFLFFCYLYDRRRSLYGPIILHIGINLIAALPQIKTMLAAHIDGEILDAYLIWSVLLFAFCINLSWFMRRTLTISHSASLADGCKSNDTSGIA